MQEGWETQKKSQEPVASLCIRNVLSLRRCMFSNIVSGSHRESFWHSVSDIQQSGDREGEHYSGCRFLFTAIKHTVRICNERVTCIIHNAKYICSLIWLPRSFSFSLLFDDKGTRRWPLPLPFPFCSGYNIMFHYMCMHANGFIFDLKIVHKLNTFTFASWWGKVFPKFCFISDGAFIQYC